MLCSSYIAFVVFGAFVVNVLARALLEDIRTDFTNVAIIKSNITQLFSPFKEQHVQMVDFKLGKYNYTSAVMYNAKAYFSGGIDSKQNVYSNVVVFDPPSNTSSSGASLPEGRYNHQSVVYNNNILVCGGITSSSSPSPVASCITWSEGNSSWTSVASMPKALSAFGMVTLNDGVYVFGGFPGDGFCVPQNTVFHFDGNTWSEKATMPWKVNDHATLRYNDTTALICGGVTETNDGICETTALCYFYDSTSDNWTQAASMNDNRISFQLMSIAGRIYAIGGSGNDDDLNTIEYYNEAKCGWALSPFKLIQPTARYASVVIEISS